MTVLVFDRFKLSQLLSPPVKSDKSSCSLVCYDDSEYQPSMCSHTCRVVSLKNLVSATHASKEIAD